MIKEILIVADPMCSWCWGFSPVLNEFINDYKKKYTFKLFLGGLRVGEENVLDEEFKTKLSDSWNRVKKVTNQDFNFDILKQLGFIYNTEPSCRAVASVRQVNPEKAFTYIEELHKAFYLENKNITDSQFLLNEAVKLGIDENAYSELYNSESFKQELYSEFEYVAHLGVQVFPAVLVHTDTGFTILSQGYHPYHKIKKDLENIVLRHS